MQLIDPSVEIIQESDIYKKIELCGRVCYKSEDKITNDSAKKLIANIIKRGHESVLEHAWIQYTACYDGLPFDNSKQAESVCMNVRRWRNYFRLYRPSYDYYPYGEKVYERYCVLKHYYPELFQDINVSACTNEVMCTDNNYFNRVYTVNHNPAHILTTRFICDRGVTHEWVRHRLFSFSQESTRYVNYLNRMMQFIMPCWLDGKEQSEKEKFYCLLEKSESLYNEYIRCGWSPQEARSILPNCLKTEIITTGEIDYWKFVLSLRAAKDAHPDMQKLMRILIKTCEHSNGCAKELYHDYKDRI